MSTVVQWGVHVTVKPFPVQWSSCQWLRDRDRGGRSRRRRLFVKGGHHGIGHCHNCGTITGRAQGVRRRRGRDIVLLADTSEYLLVKQHRVRGAQDRSITQQYGLRSSVRTR